MLPPLPPLDELAARRDVEMYGETFLLREGSGQYRRLDPGAIRRLDKAARDMAAAYSCTLEEAVATINRAIDTDLTAMRRVRAALALRRLADHFALLDR